MAQFARPDSDVTNTGTNGFGAIDEITPSDADFWWGDNNTAEELEVGLSNVTDPTISSGHIFRYRIAKTNAGTVDGTGNAVTVTARLMQGTTEIAADTAKTADGTWTEYSLTLTGGQTDAITDYTDLRLEFVTSASGGSPANRRGGAVSWAELEVPDASTTVSPDVIALAVVLPASSALAASTVAPEAIALSSTHPAASAIGETTVLPDVIALIVVIPQATGSSTSWEVSDWSGEEWATAFLTPSVIALTVVTPAATTLGAAVVEPDTIALSVTTPPVTIAAAATVTPATIALSVTLPPAEAVVTDEGTAAPATIVLSVGLPPVEVSREAFVTPAVIGLTVAMDQAIGAGAATLSPAVIALAAVLSPVTLTAGANQTVDVIGLVVVFPPAQASAASAVFPNVIVMAVTLDGVVITAAATILVTPIGLIVVLPQASPSTHIFVDVLTIALVVNMPGATTKIGVRASWMYHIESDVIAPLTSSDTNNLMIETDTELLPISSE